MFKTHSNCAALSVLYYMSLPTHLTSQWSPKNSLLWNINAFEKQAHDTILEGNVSIITYLCWWGQLLVRPGWAFKLGFETDIISIRFKLTLLLNIFFLFHLSNKHKTALLFLKHLEVCSTSFNGYLHHRMGHLVTSRFMNMVLCYDIWEGTVTLHNDIAFFSALNKKILNRLSFMSAVIFS